MCGPTTTTTAVWFRSVEDCTATVGTLEFSPLPTIDSGAVCTNQVLKTFSGKSLAYVQQQCIIDAALLNQKCYGVIFSNNNVPGATVPVGTSYKFCYTDVPRYGGTVTKWSGYERICVQLTTTSTPSTTAAPTTVAPTTTTLTTTTPTTAPPTTTSTPTTSTATTTLTTSTPAATTIPPVS
jgi:hypothetical protein